MTRPTSPAALSPSPLTGSAHLAEERSFLIARIGSKRIAFDMRQVREVGRQFDWVEDSTPAGATPPGFVGLKNIRGTVVPVLELGIEPRTAGTRLVVLREENGLHQDFAAIVVDHVLGVRSLNARDISRPRLPEPDGAIAYLHFGEEDCVPLHAPSSLLQTSAAA